jgi:calcineurin-like phosphoesterase family protein
MNWYTSDTHAYHANIIKYQDRPFKDAEEMSQKLADNINDVVGSKDVLFHLGDWAFGVKRDRSVQLEASRKFREMINCEHVVLLWGNHDYRMKGMKEFQQLFDDTQDILEVKDYDAKEKIILCHYALRVWNAQHHGRWHLYGHSHGRLPDPDAFAFDVGVDSHNYTPLCSLDVSRIMQEKWDRGVRPLLHSDDSVPSKVV